MWRTPFGERTLKGAEWELFREGLDMLWDIVEESPLDPDLYATGVEAFDSLEVGQRLALMAQVATALSKEDVPSLPLTVNTEATVAAVFSTIAKELSQELDYASELESSQLGTLEGLTHWRLHVVNTYRETIYQEALDADEADGWELPVATSLDAEEWASMIDELSERILWDDDYTFNDVFLDLGPSDCERLKTRFRISVDYFTDVALDPNETELKEIRRTLRRLCGRPEPKA